MRDPNFLEQHQHDPIAYAKALGTYGKIDRTKQYESQRYSSDALLRNDNLLFERQRRLEQLHLRYVLLAVTLTAVISNADKIYSFFFR